MSDRGRFRRWAGGAWSAAQRERVERVVFGEARTEVGMCDRMPVSNARSGAEGPKEMVPNWGFSL